MSGWKGHIAGGIVCLSVYTAAVSLFSVGRFARLAGLVYEWQVLAAVFVLGLLFSIFPDVDTNSKAQDIIYRVIFGLDILLVAMGFIQLAAYLGLIAMLPVLGHHRGWTHRKWAAIVVTLPVLLFPLIYNQNLWPIAIICYGAAVVGYFSHLFLDGMLFKHHG